MPCNCDYLEANGREKSLSQVACLLDELDGKPLDKDHWRGYHPAVYNQQVDGDRLVARLCGRLYECDDVTRYSLEMQMWWRDHLEADKARVERELAEQKNAEDRAAAIAKLTPRERDLLGL